MGDAFGGFKTSLHLDGSTEFAFHCFRIDIRMMGSKLECPLHYLCRRGGNGERPSAWELIIPPQRAILYTTGDVPTLNLRICCDKFHCHGLFRRFAWHT